MKVKIINKSHDHDYASEFIEEHKSKHGIWECFEIRDNHIKVKSDTRKQGYWTCSFSSHRWEKVYEEIRLPKELFEI